MNKTFFHRMQKSKAALQNSNQKAIETAVSNIV